MTELNIGICGAGIGGLAAAIAIRKAGARVTVLEAAVELGEIGAGIQMTPSVARLLINGAWTKLLAMTWWSSKYILSLSSIEAELINAMKELNMRRKDGTKIGYIKTVPNVRK